MWPFKYPYTNFHEINLDWLLGTVKSNTDRITENELKIKLIGGDDPLNSLHPVGSIFISAENTSPASLFGGVWEQIGGKFLLGADSTHAAGSTGGEAEHTLTNNELPKITGSAVMRAADTNYNIILSASGVFNTNLEDSSSSTLTFSGAGKMSRLNMSFGGNAAHNNIPPYLAVCMWKRVG